ncbi:MAG TPA: glycosyl hydrolase, partial [Clostridiales bacterium UBA8960]|nr:glycosyl hydrolase [Clostridiales bacterium UBA8960]
NFEYFSEDPYMTGELAAAMIRGVQEKGIGTSLKHFAVNNQEHNRMTIDAFVDVRALREIYLTGFEKAVQIAQPWTVMCSYNRINSVYACEHEELLTGLLKKSWGHEGIVVTDWGAMNRRVDSLKAGLEVEMPTSYGATDAEIVSAVQSGLLDEAVLDEAVRRILRIILMSMDAARPGYVYDKKAQHTLARRAAAESTVLLKNDGNVLPFKDAEEGTTFAIIGEFAKIPRYQGAGSSLVNPTQLDTAFDAFVNRMGFEPLYAPGYSVKNDQADDERIREACRVAERSDRVVLMVGLTDRYESEGFDRDHLNLPSDHDALVRAVLAVKPDAVVVLCNGSPVAMPWVKDARAVVEVYLAGQAGGSALWDVLFGDINPSGKLAETFPLSVDRSASHRWFPMGPKGVEYRESIYVGYRYYDASGEDVLFPFGHGLSYTQFEYSNIKSSHEKCKDDETVTISVDVTNKGERFGKEVVQLYVRDHASLIFRADKALKGFEKVSLEPGQTKTVTFSLDKRSFAYFSTSLSDFYAASGTYEILIGRSSVAIEQSLKLTLVSTTEYDPTQDDLRHALPEYYDLKPGWDVSKEAFETLYGGPIVHEPVSRRGTFHLNSTVSEMKHTFIGGLVYKLIMRQLAKMFDQVEEKQVAMVRAMIDEMPLRNFTMMAEGKVKRKHVQVLIRLLNL